MNSEKTLFIDAYNLKSGGGLVVLNCLIDALNELKIEYLIVSNQKSLQLKNDKIKYVRNLIHRELYLYGKGHILYLSNIVPLFVSKSTFSIFYLHQRYWIDKTGMQYQKGIRSKLLYGLKYQYFQIFSNNISEYIVQTYDMQNLFYLNKKVRAKVYPLFKKAIPENRESQEVKKEEICLLIGDDTPHKQISLDHPLLKCLEKNGIDYYWVGYKGRINSDGSISSFIDREILMNLLLRSKYVFIPSSFESLGLPVLEAAGSKCIIIVDRSYPLLDELIVNYYLLQDIFDLPLPKEDFSLPFIKIRDTSLEFSCYLMNILNS